MINELTRHGKKAPDGFVPKGAIFQNKPSTELFTKSGKDGDEILVDRNK